MLVGAQRSGTTALGHALSAAHARAGGCFTVNGKLFYLAARWIADDDLVARHLRVDELCHALDRRPAGGEGATRWRARLEAALRVQAARIADGRGDPAATLVRDVAAAAYGNGPWGDKYNEYLLDLPYLHRLYPRARWLFVHRHPSEAAASMLAWTGDRPWRPADVEGCELKWAEWNERWLAFRERVPEHQRLEVSYDALCTPAGLCDVGRYAGVELPDGCMSRRRPPAGPPRTSRAADVWSRLSALHPSPASV
jgi:hypothetical protein